MGKLWLGATYCNFFFWGGFNTNYYSEFFQCPKKVVTEAPPLELPTPTPTLVEQKSGGQVNCSCGAGAKVKTSTFLFTFHCQNLFSVAVDTLLSFNFSQGEIGAPGVAGERGEKVVYPCL